jgi:ATP-dependent DNA ligase
MMKLIHLEEHFVAEDVRRAERALDPHWQNSLLAEIEYRAKSAEGKVRHPIFKGLREDL